MAPDSKFVCPRNVIHHDLASELDARSFGHLTGHFWEQLELPLFLRKKGEPLLLCLGNTGPLFYWNQFITIYDLSFFHNPEWFSRQFTFVYNLLIPAIAKRSRHIFTDSNYVRDDIIKTYNIAKDKISVIYGDSSAIFKKPQNCSTSDYILAVGSIDPRKNLAGLVKAYLKLETNIRLVIVGQKNKVFSHTDLEVLIGDNAKITMTGYVTDDELAILYAAAKVFVYPSYMEGFGIPPLEAQACGCPVIVSNVASLPEVCADSVLYFNPHDENDIAATIQKVLNSEQIRNELRQKGFKNIQRFCWEKSAQIIYSKLREIE